MHGDKVATVPDHGDAGLGAGEPARLIDKRHAARLLGGITVREVERRIADKDLEAVKLGRRCLVVVASLDQYVARLRGRTT